MGDIAEAWYLDDSSEDPRLPNKPDPTKYVTQDDLRNLGLLLMKLNPVTIKSDGVLERIKRERGYKNYEEYIEYTPTKLSAEKLRGFYEEHLHTDEEIRLIVEGGGYFEVRDHDDRWIRIRVTPGVLIVLPAMMYHRFSLDTNEYMKAMRLYTGEPVWIAHNRSSAETDGTKA